MATKNMTIGQIVADFKKVKAAVEVYKDAAKTIKKATRAEVAEANLVVETRTYTYRGQKLWIKFTLDFDTVSATIVPDQENSQFKMRISMGDRIEETELKRLLEKYVIKPEPKKAKGKKRATRTAKAA